MEIIVSDNFLSHVFFFFLWISRCQGLLCPRSCWNRNPGPLRLGLTPSLSLSKCVNTCVISIIFSSADLFPSPWPARAALGPSDLQIEHWLLLLNKERDQSLTDTPFTLAKNLTYTHSRINQPCSSCKYLSPLARLGCDVSSAMTCLGLKLGLLAC